MSEDFLHAVFKPQGSIAKHFKQYEERPQQEIMARGVWRAFQENKHLIVEAGTGVGKSFAYLVPAILFAVDNSEKVIISTKTLNLQDQLINKDIPYLKKALDIPFVFRVLKGRNNYICLRRLKFVDDTFDKNLAGGRGREELELIKRWVSNTKTGTRDDLPFMPESQVWSMVCSESSACRGKKCLFYKNCFYYYAKSLLSDAHVIVVNHSLYFSDLVLGVEGSGTGILPKHNYVIIDEAHTIEEIASSHIGNRISNSQIMYTLRSLYNTNKNTGFLVDYGTKTSLDICMACQRANAYFFDRIENQSRERAWKGEFLWELQPQDTIKDDLTDHLFELAGEIGNLEKGIDDSDEALSDLKAELSLRHDRILELYSGIKQFIQGDRENNFVYWVEFDSGAGRNMVSLNWSPLDVSDYLRENLFGSNRSVVMTGATLETTLDDNFEYLTRKVGLTSYTGIRLDSPYDFKNKVTFYLAKNIPSPKHIQFKEHAEEKVKQFITEFQGGILILFTSYKMMNDFAADLGPYISVTGRSVFIQGQGKNRTMLLESFQKAENGVLFATSSFWVGIDVPGKALSNVLIMRLPFAVPSHPVTRGKSRIIRDNGGNPFMDYFLPEAILAFKQGVGRLLRSKKDKGNIVVLDSRIVNKKYGKFFRSVIPECRIEYF